MLLPRTYLHRVLISKKIYLISESLVDVSLSEKIKSESALCNRCNYLVEKFDDLQAQTRKVQEDLTGMLQHLQQTQSEQIFIKQEPEECFSGNELTKSDESDEDEALKSDDDDDDDDYWTNTEFMDEDSVRNEDSYCEKCSKSFKNAHCLQMHLATDHDRNEGAVECPICSKTYKNRSLFKTHYVNHSSSFLCGR